jgi:hypothetical protein
VIGRMKASVIGGPRGVSNLKDAGIRPWLNYNTRSSSQCACLIKVARSLGLMVFIA